ncbi:hypothetical protein SynSYN20_03193 [Synechococcus sp. SYN20]|nr:hypothetical protein SynSYN20_03193 [Synechococcus sp. SYN20]
MPLLICLFQSAFGSMAKHLVGLKQIGVKAVGTESRSSSWK